MRRATFHGVFEFRWNCISASARPSSPNLAPGSSTIIWHPPRRCLPSIRRAISADIGAYATIESQRLEEDIALARRWLAPAIGAPGHTHWIVEGAPALSRPE
jgi:hypothetical protein